jgi:signal transduction histidine kinase
MAMWGILALLGVLAWWLAPARSRWQGAGVACLCLALGGIAGELLASWRDRGLRGELLQRCRHLAAGLDRADLAAHRNLPEDIAQPWGLRIHTRLREARQSDPEVIYAYLMERVGGTVVFPNGDDAPGDPDFVPLGTAYDDIPVAMEEAVTAGKDFALGPYSDRWGEFISVGTAVELAGQRRVTVALDVLAARWRSELLIWRSWPIALGAALAVVAVLLWSRSRALAATRVAVREAEAANRAKDAYLATVSHDLRNPLSGIIGMTGLLADSDLTPQQREHVQLAHNSGQQLLSLVNELLDYARIEAGELALDRVQCSVRELVEDSVALLAPLATAKGVELNAVVSRDVPESLLGDPDRIRQILHNLVGNAVKFTDEGEVVVRVSAAADATGRVRIAIAVRDTGIGIDAATIARLFQPFAQGSEAGRRRGGTGLGLCIAQRIARALGGDVTVESAPGAGSTFTAALLLEPDPQPASADGISAVRRGSRVLLGIVQPSLREGLAETLIALGLEPVPAADAAAIAGLAAATPPPSAAIIEASWARGLLPALEAAGIPAGLVSARSAGGTQMLASRRTPVLLRPVRRESLLRLLGGLWGTRSSSTRRFTAVASGVEPGVRAPTPAPLPVVQLEDDYAPSLDSREPPPPPQPPQPAIPVAALAGGLLGGLRSGIDAVREAARTGDLGTVRRAAQGLRSAAEPLRLTELADTCIALEVAASGGDKSAVRDIAINLDDVRRRTQQAISELSRKQSR